MATIFIFHGIDGHPEENWFPWLRNELERTGHRVVVPKFPHTDHPQLDEWLAFFEQWKSLLNAEAILIGHSLGAAFALRLLERSGHPVRATFLVAPVWGVMENKFDPLMISFTLAPYDWQKIRKHAGKVAVIHSDNDPYIAPEKAEILAENLGTEATLVRNGGHFNAAAGYTTFEQLRTAVVNALL
ncbi:MAG: alpha/beta fold hydrolase [Candidatus Peribacteraceae bacterium]|nr:alpha/beta fold hydrolase [Candidatus Peribacteraceae bacterium]